MIVHGDHRESCNLVRPSQRGDEDKGIRYPNKHTQRAVMTHKSSKSAAGGKMEFSSDVTPATAVGLQTQDERC